MFLLLSYLISLALSASTCSGGTLTISDVTSVAAADLTCEGATTCIITTATDLEIAQSAFQGKNFETITISGKKITLAQQAFQQATISKEISITATDSISIGLDAFIMATVGGIKIEAANDIVLANQAFQQITKAANLSITSTKGKVNFGQSCFTTSAVAGISINAYGDVVVGQQAFQQCTQITYLEIKSTNGAVQIGITAFISAAINQVYISSYLDADIGQQAMQQVANFDNLVVETQGNFNAGMDTFIKSLIKQFYIYAKGNVTFAQQSFQETPKLANFTVNAGENIDFQITSFIKSNVNWIHLIAEGNINFGQQSFQECKNLSYIYIETAGNITFGNSAFIDSQIVALNVSNINQTSSAMLLEDSTTGVTFETQSFANCNQLKTVDIDSHGNVDVGANSFTGSTALNSVNIHSTGKATVGDNAFSGCTSLDRDHAKINGENMPDNAFGGGDDDGDKKKGGSSSHKDSDDKDEKSAKTLGDFNINSVYLGTSPNIVVDLNIFVTLMRKARLAFGHVVPSPDFIHSAIWVGKDKEVNDKSVGTIFVYGKYWNKYNMDTYLEKNGAKAIVMTLGEFKQRYPQINPMKLNANKNMKLFDFINEVKASGHWSATDYNWPTNNCQHFTAKLIDILHATRDAPANSDWADLPKPVMNSLKANEKEN